jgi:hypothetical protein
MAARLSMDTGVTGQAMGDLATTGADLVTGWQAAVGQINAAAGSLGRGTLGEAFVQGYRPHADQVARLAETCSWQPAELAGAGRQDIESYVNVDLTLSQGLARLHPGG